MQPSRPHPVADTDRSGGRTPATASLPVCNALWIGSSLGAVERNCLLSFVEAGHAVDLHVFDPLPDVPPNVRLVDAEATLSRDQLIRHRNNGSVSLFSNRFRYALMAAGRGMWVDCDVLCLRPILDAPYIFGRESEDLINGAVFKLPSGDPVLADLMAIFTDKRWVPPWANFRERLRYRLRYLTEAGFGLPDMPWGIAGPHALTYHLARRGLAALARPVDVFYPVSPSQAGLLSGDDIGAMRAHITPNTVCIHLWNKMLSELPPPASGSFLSRVAEGSWRSALGLGADSAA